MCQFIRGDEVLYVAGQAKEKSTNLGAYYSNYRERCQFGMGNSRTHSTLFLCMNVEQNRFLMFQKSEEPSKDS